MKFANDFERGYYLGINHGSLGVNLLADDKIFKSADRRHPFWRAYEVANVNGANYREGLLKGLLDMVLDAEYDENSVEIFYDAGYEWACTGWDEGAEHNEQE